MYNEETIAAISTPAGMGGISIIRISGDEAFEVIERIFKRPNNKKFADANNFSINYGHIVNKNGEVLDEVLVSKMKAPHTYTTQDVCEINCHGGFAAARSVLDLIISEGIRLAEPGEFTKRAFLGGRIDLSQAEAVSDMITSKTESFSKIAAGQIEGRLKDEIDKIKSEILTVLSNLEVTIQYPEYDIDELQNFELKNELDIIRNHMMNLSATFKKGEIYKDGLKTAIVGKPNVGKSMLLNALVNEEKAIVTDIPGTTRDVVDELIYMGGIPVKIMDTAGIRESDDKVEAIGIQKSISALENADLALFVCDVSDKLSEEDKAIYEKAKQKPIIVILNKCDKGINENTKDFFKDDNFVIMSARTCDNLEELEEKITAFAQSEPGDVASCILLVNSRHKALIDRAVNSIGSAIETLSCMMPVDLIEIDIRDAWHALGEITGETADEDIVNEIFANFCLGK